MRFCILFCRQKTAYDVRISDWIADVCPSDLAQLLNAVQARLISPEVTCRQMACKRFPLHLASKSSGFDQQGDVGCDQGRTVRGPMEAWQLAERSTHDIHSGSDRIGQEGDIATPIGVDEISAPRGSNLQIGRAHVCTPVTNAHLVCRLLLAKKK